MASVGAGGIVGPSWPLKCLSDFQVQVSNRQVERSTPHKTGCTVPLAVELNAAFLNEYWKKRRFQRNLCPSQAKWPQTFRKGIPRKVGETPEAGKVVDSKGMCVDGADGGGGGQPHLVLLKGRCVES